MFSHKIKHNFPLAFLNIGHISEQNPTYEMFNYLRLSFSSFHLLLSFLHIFFHRLVFLSLVSYRELDQKKEPRQNRGHA